MKNKLNRLYLIGFWVFTSIFSIVSIATLLGVIYYKEVGLDSTKPVENNTILEVREVKPVDEVKENKDTINVISELDTTPKIKFVVKPKVIQKKSYISDTIKIDTLKVE